MDGTSNTFMHAERFQFADAGYSLTSVQHAAGGEDSRGLWQINVQACDGSVRKGDWISDVTDVLQDGNAVAIESLTIAHEGFSLI